MKGLPGRYLTAKKRPYLPHNCGEIILKPVLEYPTGGMLFMKAGCLRKRWLLQSLTDPVIQTIKYKIFV
jgi:hypothetical protein